MDFSNYVRRYRDLSPTFSSTDQSCTSITDSADSISSFVRDRPHSPVRYPSQSSPIMSSPYSRGLGNFPPRPVQENDLGPGYNLSQRDSQPRDSFREVEENDDDFESFFGHEEIPVDRRGTSLEDPSNQGGPSSQGPISQRELR
ncbi:hypothetical protein KC19_1G333200, partial [Ceratodon purpureus]